MRICRCVSGMALRPMEEHDARPALSSACNAELSGRRRSSTRTGGRDAIGQSARRSRVASSHHVIAPISSGQLIAVQERLRKRRRRKVSGCAGFSFQPERTFDRARVDLMISAPMMQPGGAPGTTMACKPHLLAAFGLAMFALAACSQTEAQNSQFPPAAEAPPPPSASSSPTPASTTTSPQPIQ